jgi:alpha-tubulin suppressor-like RCC1 family protein
MGNSINITNQLQGNVTGNVTGSITGLAGSVTSGGNIHIGVITATSYSGDGSNLTGIAATNFNTQTVTANAAETIIDLSDGNMITMNQSADTTVGFASTSTAMDVTILRFKDSSPTARTITWPDSIKWNGGSAPTLITDSQTGDGDVNQIQLLTRDGGLTWYGWENMSNEGELYQLFLWGPQSAPIEGNLAQNDNAYRSSPVQVPGEWKSASSSYNWSQGVKTNGTFWVWGKNNYGQMGDNTTVSRSSPVQMPGTTWNKVNFYARGDNTGAVKTDGTLWVWGRNTNGEIGINQPTNSHKSSPVQVPGTTWRSVSGTYCNIAVKTDGTAWSWGQANGGKLGLNDTTQRSSPTQIGTDTTWSATYSGTSSSIFAIKTDGTVWGWQNNGNGNLGQNNRTVYSSPIQIPGTYTSTSAGYYGWWGLKTDGTLWGCGNNANGELGQNSIGAGGGPANHGFSSPVQVPGSWSAVSGGKATTAIKTDGTMWIWGNNGYQGNVPFGFPARGGGLGLNGPVALQLSSPTQLPGTWALTGILKSQSGANIAFKKSY